MKVSNISNSKYINIIDRIVLGQNKYLAIVEISNKYYLLSITDASINIIKELDDIEIDYTEKKEQKIEFDKIFNKFLKSTKKDK